ncbi:hypothetical protein CR513_34449, partial [Mucuna pruriens]
MLNAREPSIVQEPKNSSLATKGIFFEDDNRKKTMKNSIKSGCELTFQTTIKEIQKPPPISKTNPFIKEQLQYLYQLFYPKMIIIPSCSLAHKCIYLTTAISRKILKPLGLLSLEQLSTRRIVQNYFYPIAILASIILQHLFPQFFRNKNPCLLVRLVNLLNITACFIQPKD